MSIAPAPVADLVVRPASLDDAAFVADLFTALDPDEPFDPHIQRYQWENAPPEQVFERFIVERSGAPVGFAAHAHMPWEKLPKRYGFVAADVMPGLRSAERLSSLYDFAEQRSRRDGTEVFSTWSRETDAFRIEFLTQRGYREERRGRWWELDLVANAEHLLAMAEASRAHMRRESVRILTLRDDADGEKYRQTWRCYEESVQDVPTTVPIVPQPLEQFMTWLRRPGFREDRFWIARDAADVVGVSVLQYPPVRGNVETAWTGTKRAARGRGVARALKLETIAQAIALGVARIRTGNDSTNAPILHLNEELGYRAIPGSIQFLKDVSYSWRPPRRASRTSAARSMATLVEAGADVNVKQRHGWTPRHGAAHEGDAELVGYLVAKGADRSARNDEGKTLADVARERGHERVAALLG